jgi:branched-subunit amino acid transport protein
MNFQGIIIGIVAFFIIGIFHPIVIKAEYYFGKKIWPGFLLAGIIFALFSIFVPNQLISILLGITAFTCFWSIHEVIEQEERVRKGWFPQNPHRKKN